MNHGHYGTRVYRCWGDMLTRCRNSKSTAYDYYGGAGIGVCDAWKDAGTFIRWAHASGYTDDLTIDRIDPLGHYEPSNCRWVTMTVQSRNTRLLSRHNTSGYRCVGRHKKKWAAYIRVDGRKIHLGTFENPREAAEEYDAFVIAEGMEHTLNFPRGAT